MANDPRTKLKDRILWADGISVVEPTQVEDAILSGIPLKALAVTELTDEVKRLNLLSDDKLLQKQELSFQFPPRWIIPERYEALELDRYLLDLVRHDELYEQRLQRLALELELFERHDMLKMLRALIYVIDKLKDANIIWGVGRGSSCSSYILYLIGLHAVDPVKYQIDIKDFIR